MEEDLSIKSILITEGATMLVPPGFSHPYADAKDEYSGTIIISAGSTRMRMKYSTEKGRFVLKDGSLYLDDEMFIKDVQFVQAFCHSPFQANVNLPKFDSIDDILEHVRRIVSTGTVKGIPMSGDPETPLQDYIDAISAIHSEFPDIPIGLSYRPCPKGDLMRLKDAGLSEFKITVGSTVERIFNVLQPGVDLYDVIGCLEDAVQVFGKGKVQTGLFIGLGESDAAAISSMRYVSERGILTDLKVKKLTPKNREAFESKLGKIEPVSAERLERLSKELKTIQEENGLDTNTVSTLCLACRCCNIVPFKDF